MATGIVESSVHVEENREQEKPIDREKVSDGPQLIANASFTDILLNFNYLLDMSDAPTSFLCHGTPSQSQRLQPWKRPSQRTPDLHMVRMVIHKNL